MASTDYCSIEYFDLKLEAEIVVQVGIVVLTPQNLLILPVGKTGRYWMDICSPPSPNQLFQPVTLHLIRYFWSPNYPYFEKDHACFNM